MSSAHNTIKQEKVVEEVNDDGKLVKYKVVTTSVRVKKSVLRRRELPKFGSVAKLTSEDVTVRENRPIEIRCLPPRPVEEATEPFEIDLLLEAKNVTRCKNCGMPGHFSLRCPKRKEIEPRAPREEIKESPEITICLSNLPDSLYDRPFQDMIREFCRGLHIPCGIGQIKCNIAKDSSGTPTGRGYINLLDHEQEHADLLVGELDRYQLGHSIIQAEIIPSRRDNRRRGPNKYDDEANFGASRDDRPWRKF